MRLFRLGGLIILAALTMGAAAASAQNPKDIAAYQEAAGWDMPLYRGKQFVTYSYRYNGTYFWDNGGFRKGSIFYGGKLYQDVTMNIDAFRQVLCVRYENRIQTWELDRNLVEWAMFGDKKVVNLRACGISKAPEGFFEVIHEGKECVYRQVNKNYVESLSASGYSRIGYEDPDYNENIFVFFAYSESFYFLDKNGKFEKFSSRNYLIKKHPELKKPLRAQIKSNRWGDLPLDLWCKLVMNYIESAK